MEIKRYSVPMVVEYNGVEEDPEGEWVRWGDSLVQAAPDLLEALEYYLPLLENCNRYGPEGDAARDSLAGDIGEKARAAIAKATEARNATRGL